MLLQAELCWEEDHDIQETLGFKLSYARGKGRNRPTYISVKSSERLDHVESMHVDNGSIYCELGSDARWVKVYS